jgi:Spy/CpxP family protein refolding chaperone
MNKINLLNVGLAMVGLLVLAGWLMAEPPAEPQPAPAQPEAMPMIPNLTDTQMEQIQALRIKHLKEVMPIETDIRIKELELDALWHAEKFDAKQIVAKVKEIGELKNKLALAKVNHQIEIYNLLTPEQRKMFRRRIGLGRELRQRMHRRFRAMEQGPMAPDCCPNR